MSMTMRTASVIILDEEILGGTVNNHIAPYLTKELKILKYDLQKLTVIPKNENVVTYEIDITIKHYDILIIVGGFECGFVYKVLGRLFSQDIQQNAQLEWALNGSSSGRINTSETCIPVNAKVLTGNCYPLVYMQRIFLLTRQHLEDTYTQILKQHLVQYRKEPRYVKRLCVNHLNGSTKNIEDLVKLSENGTRVELKRDGHSLCVKLSSSELVQILQIEEEIRKSWFQNLSSDIFDSFQNVYQSTDALIKSTLENIEECFKQYKPENVFLSFNGGKDCTVLLHLIFVVLRTRFPTHKDSVLCLYVQSENPFSEQDEFLDQCQRYYNLNVLTIRSGIKEALQQVLTEHPNYRACFMGTRRTDPYCSNLKVFQMTDLSWPQIMRVSPLLDWHYSDIWDYLLYHKIPYCKLYDWGYTSLGNRINTVRNPSLLYYNVFEGKEMYLPAYKLLDESQERHGRGKNAN